VSRSPSLPQIILDMVHADLPPAEEQNATETAKTYKVTCDRRNVTGIDNFAVQVLNASQVFVLPSAILLFAPTVGLQHHSFNKNRPPTTSFIPINHGRFVFYSSNKMLCSCVLSGPDGVPERQRHRVLRRAVLHRLVPVLGQPGPSFQRPAPSLSQHALPGTGCLAAQQVSNITDCTTMSTRVPLQHTNVYMCPSKTKYLHVSLYNKISTCVPLKQNIYMCPSKTKYLHVSL